MPDVYRASASLEFRVEDQVGLKSPPGEEATSKKKKRKGAPKCSSEEARVGAASGEHPGKVTPERGETKAVSGGNGKGAVSSEHGKLSVLEQTETVGLQNRARGCDGDGAVSNTPTEEMGRLGAIGGPGLTGESSSGLEDGARLEGRGSGRVGIASGGRLDGGPADVTASGGRLEGGPADVVNTATRGSGIKPRTKRKRAAGVGVSVPEGLGGRPNRDIAAGGLKEEYGGLERGLWEGLLRGLKEEEGEIAGSTRDVSEAAGVGRRGETCSLVEESPEEIERPHPDVGTLDKHKHIAEKFQWERNISPGNGEEEGVSEESGGMEWGQRRKRARGPNVAADLDGLSGRSKVDGMLELPAASLEAGQKLGRFGDSGAESADAALSTSAEDSAVEERREEKGDGNVGAEEQEKREQGGQGKEEKQSDPEEKERGAETKTGEEERKELGGGNGEKTEGCRGKAEKKEGSASDSRLSGVDDVDWEEAFLSLKPLSPPLSPFQLRLAQSPGPQPEGSPYKFLRTPEVVHPPQPDSGPVPPDCGVSGAGGDVMLTSPEGGALALPRLVEKLPSPVACQTVPAGSPLVGARNPQTVPPSNSPSLSLLDGPLSVAPPQTFTNPLESLPATDSIGGVQNPESASEEAPESPRVSPVQAADLLSTPPRNQGVPSAQKTPPRSCQTSTCPVDPALGPTPESKHKRRRMSLSPAVKKRLVSLASPLSQNGADDSDPFSNPRGSPYFARKRRSETQVNGNMVGDARLLKHRPEEGSVSGGFERGASKSDLSFPGGQQRWGTEGEEGERQFSQKKRAKFNLWLDEGTPTKGALAESPLGLSGRVGVGRNGEIGTDGGLEGSNPGGGEPLEAHSLGANSLGARNSSGAVLKDRSDLDCGPTERGKSELRVTEQVEGGGSLGTGTPGVERWLMLPEGTGFDAEARARGDEPGAGRQLETRAEVPGGSAQSGVDRLRENLSRTLERVGVKMAKADGECGAQRGSQVKAAA